MALEMLVASVVGVIFALLSLRRHHAPDAVGLGLFLELCLLPAVILVFAGAIDELRVLGIFVAVSLLALTVFASRWRSRRHPTIVPFREEVRPLDGAWRLAHRRDEAAEAGLERVGEREIGWRVGELPRGATLWLFRRPDGLVWVEVLAHESRWTRPCVSVVSLLPGGRVLRTSMALSWDAVLTADGIRVRRVPQLMEIGGMVAAHDAELARLGVTPELVADPPTAHVEAVERWHAALVREGRLAQDGDDLRVAPAAVPWLVGRILFAWIH